MEKQLALSFVLPCFNVEKYIAECFDSLYAQDISEVEFEVICVNDCSTDSTRDIILKYQKSHPNLVLIDHDINKKQGVARNTGIKAARGEYIWFVDPDDFIQKNILAKTLSKCINRLDILTFNYIKLYSGGETVEVKLSSVSNVENGVDMCLNSKRVWDLCWLPFKVFRRDFLIENEIKFIDFNYFEDLDFVIRALCKAEKVQSLDDNLYFYRQNLQSTTNSIPQNFLKGYEFYMSYIYIGQRLIELSKEIPNVKLSGIIFEGGLWRINQFTRFLLKAPTKEKNRFFTLLKENEMFLAKVIPNMNVINVFIVKYQVISKFVLCSINPVIQFLLKLKNR